MAGTIRVGIGGWNYEPWRNGVFFPAGLPQKQELAHASAAFTVLEVNGTYYRTQTPATFAKWAEQTPDDFVFALKAVRYCTNRKVLAEAAESVAKFVGSGLAELGDKLGPILWQFMPTKRFEREDVSAFLDLLPSNVGGRALRHAIEVRHESFRDPAFVDMARARGVAIVFADSAKYPCIADPTAHFVYARLEDAKEAVQTGYTEGELDRFADVAKSWARGEAPGGLDYVDAAKVTAQVRDVFVFMINGAKVRAPAAAQALLTRL